MKTPYDSALWRALALALAMNVVTAGTVVAQARADAAKRVVLVTGSTDGLGREVAKRLAAGGAHVIVHGRNRERGLAVVDEIKKAGKGSASFYAADFGSIAQVRAFADTILKHYPKIDVLVNNAGIWLRQGPKQLSADGYEMTMAVNYLAGVVLTRALLPRLIASAPSRIVNVASQSQSAINLDDPMQERDYVGQRGYSTSKLAQVMFTIDLAKELEGKKVTVVSLHPASLMDTRMVEMAGVAPRSTIDEGAVAVMNAINAPGLASGIFLNGLREGRANPQAYDDAARARLREWTERWMAKK